MASGRVGGTKAKISGTVGSEVYSIKKGAGGSLVQVVSPKVERTVNKTSVRLGAQRMCTAMVESLMRDLAPVGRVSFQSAANKSKSLNAFSQFNLLRVAQACKDEWFESRSFVFPEKGMSVQQGGEWILSSGSLKGDLFQSIASTEDRNGAAEWPVSASEHADFVTLRLTPDMKTVADFLTANRLLYSSKMVHVAFVMNIGTFKGRYIYEIIGVNPYAYGSLKINHADPVATFRNVFTIQSNQSPFVRAFYNKSALAVGSVVRDVKYDEQFFFHGAFSMTPVNGQLRISSAQLTRTYGFSGSYIVGNSPQHSVKSFLDNPPAGIIPYPF